MRVVCSAKAGAGSGGTVRSLYEAAMREVQSDPLAAVTKYQPAWIAALSQAPPRAAAGDKARATPKTTARKR